MELPPYMEMVEKRIGGALVCEFWGYYNMLYTIGTGTIRQFQWYRLCSNSTKSYMSYPQIWEWWGKAWWVAGFLVLVLL
jgi:hypothetical protein